MPSRHGFLTTKFESRPISTECKQLGRSEYESFLAAANRFYKEYGLPLEKSVFDTDCQAEELSLLRVTQDLALRYRDNVRRIFPDVTEFEAYTDVDGKCLFAAYQIVDSLEDCYFFPIGHTYNIREDLGLFLRKFLKTVCQYAGIQCISETYGAYYCTETLLDMDEDDSFDEELRQSFVDYGCLEGVPSEVGIRIREFRSLQGLTPEEFDSFVPVSDKERQIVDELTPYRSFLSGACQELKEMSLYQILDEFDENDPEYIPVGEIITWGYSPHDSLITEVEQSINSSLNEGYQIEPLAKVIVSDGESLKEYGTRADRFRDLLQILNKIFYSFNS